MPAKLYLLRHGETHSNVAKIYQGQGDSKLTPNGLLMAEEVSEYLKKEKFAGIFCSDLTRSRDTAKIISRHHGVEPEELILLRERHYGSWENLTFAEINQRYSALYKIWLTDPLWANIPQAETILDLQRRAVEAIGKILARHKDVDGNICVVGHGGINRAILFYFLGLDLNHFWKIRQSNCCVNIIEFGERAAPTVSLVNSTCFIKNAQVNQVPVY